MGSWDNGAVLVEAVKGSMPNSTAIADMEQEIAIYEGYLGEFGYPMFVLQKGRH